MAEVSLDKKKPAKMKRKIWHPQQQLILKKWGEIGSSYRYLHDKAYTYFSRQNFRFALPVIILSTITGTSNFAQGSFPEEAKTYVPLVIGFLNLSAGLITTIAQFLRVSELLEGHRAASISYSKFSRNIAVELSLPIKQRTMGGAEFITNCRSELDRLIEQSPNIPDHILKEFGNRFKDKEFVKPEILDIGAVEIYIDEEDEEEKAELLAEKKKARERKILEEAEKKKQELLDVLRKEKEKEEKIAMKAIEMRKIQKKERITGGTIANNMTKLIQRLNTSREIIDARLETPMSSALPSPLSSESSRESDQNGKVVIDSMITTIEDKDASGNTI